LRVQSNSQSNCQWANSHAIGRRYTCGMAIFNSWCINELREAREDFQFEPEVGDGDGKRAMEFSNRRSIVLFLILIMRSYTNATNRRIRKIFDIWRMIRFGIWRN